MPRTSIEWLDALVRHDTTSRNSNLGLVAEVRDWLEALGIACTTTTDPTGRKANLHAVIGPAVAGGVALSGHVDTVPVDGQAWTGDPFTLRHAMGHGGDRLLARGTADMKGFVACCLAAAPRLQRAGLRRPVHLLFTYDEEISCDGARVLIEALDTAGPRPAMCIVGEPTGMQPVLAHKGRLALQVDVRGVTGHSAQPAHGANAVQAAAEAVAWVARDARRIAAEGPFADGFDPPHTTVHVGTIEGGTILNIIPEQARFVMEWRTIPGDDFFDQVERLRAFVEAEIAPALRAVDPAAGFTLDVLNWIPGLSLDPGHDLAGLVRQLTGSNSTGRVSYGTEAGLFQDAGIPTIVCGPGHIAQAHRPDEWIAVDQMAACDAFIDRLAARLAA